MEDIIASMNLLEMGKEDKISMAISMVEADTLLSPTEVGSIFDVPDSFFC